MFEQLADSSWQRVDASGDVDTIHEEILHKTTEVLSAVSDEPIHRLWTKREK